MRAKPLKYGLVDEVIESVNKRNLDEKSNSSRIYYTVTRQSVSRIDASASACA